MVKRLEARDVPSQVEAEAQADLAGALHEVSNALTVVLGWLDAARGKLPEGPARDALEVARTHADLGHRIARNAIGAQVAEEGDRSAASVARAVVLGVTQEARRRGVRVALCDDDVDDPVLREAARAHQILVNLLLNAIAFTPVGGKVTVSLAREGGRVVFRVTDEGPGVEPERADSILTAPVSTRCGGAGVGLPYSASLARTCGGELRLAHPGPGATFELCWPTEQTRSLVQQRAPAAVSLAGMRVLVIEDDPAVRSLVEFALETHGVTVLAAASEDEVVELFEGGTTFDAALVDLSPFEDAESEALELLETAAREGASLILISGLITTVPSALEGRIAAWVRKPFEMSEVVRVLQRIPRGLPVDAASGQAV
jgi:CheY-like chemotaxis protein